MAILPRIDSRRPTPAARAGAARKSVWLLLESLESRWCPSSVAFAPAAGSPFGVGVEPVSVAVGDFNDDGIADVATANFGGNSVSVLLGNGLGGFAPAADSPFYVGNKPYAIAVEDFNGDGNGDLAIAIQADDAVSVLLGNGAGGFAPAPDSPFPVGHTPQSVAVGDFNGDGNADLATANGGGNSVSVLLGDGLGGFAAAAGSPIAVGGTPFAVVVGEFNGDGQADLATANPANDTLSVLLGDGLGGSPPAAGSPIAVGHRPDSLAVGDFNGDGRADLATANLAGNSVSVLLGDGSGGFAPAAGSPIAVGNKPLGIAVEDFDGDGKADFVTANSFADTVSVLLGDGTGGFATAVNFSVGSTLATPESVAVGDFNGDGKADFVTANTGTNSVSVLLNQTVAIHYQFGGFLPPLTENGSYHAGSIVPIKFQLTDFNGDFISRLSAVQSLQVQALDGPPAPAFDPASAGGSGLRYDPVAQQYVFNWRTSGLAAGRYRILLTLDDGTVYTLDLWLT